MPAPFTIVTFTDADGDEFPVRLHFPPAEYAYERAMEARAAHKELDFLIEKGELNPTMPVKITKVEGCLMSPAPGKFRKKPVEVEAVQWTGENSAAVAEFLGYEGDDWRADLGVLTVSDFYRVVRGDFIVRFPDGATEPVSAHKFEETYEPA